MGVVTGMPFMQWYIGLILGEAVTPELLQVQGLIHRD